MTKWKPVSTGSDFIKRFWEESWVYTKTVIDIVREPILILDMDLRVIAANDPFYAMFRVKPKDTEKKVVYKLGNGQWDIPRLRSLLEGVLPKHTFFKGFEVKHDFPSIGSKVMILNARRIHCAEDPLSKEFMPIILLAIEDVTDMVGVAEALAQHIVLIEKEIGKLNGKSGKGIVG
jgi:two-component system CheB/CheR fusion protein